MSAPEEVTVSPRHTTTKSRPSIAELREEILHDVLVGDYAGRHGYFEERPSLAIGDNSIAGGVPFRKLVGVEGQTPFYTGKKTPHGKTKDVYFSQATPLCVGAPYQGPANLTLDREQHNPRDNKYFYSAGRPDRKGDYEYVPSTGQVVDPKQVYAFHKGRQSVRGIFTNPPKKGRATPGILLSKFPEHVPEMQSGPSRFEKREGHFEVAFRTSSHGGECFTADKLAYKDVAPGMAPVAMHRGGPRPHFAPKTDQPFVPANPPPHGVLGTIGKFIGLPADGSRPVGFRNTRVRKEGQAEWRDNTRQMKHKPTPSVALNVRNLRSERPASFARPSLR